MMALITRPSIVRKPLWKIHPHAEFPNWLELRSTGHDEWKFNPRWDGCVHIERFSNGDTPDKHSEENRDYLHVCDIDDFIARLVEAKEIARKKFGEQWPEC